MRRKKKARFIAKASEEKDFTTNRSLIRALGSIFSDRSGRKTRTRAPTKMWDNKHVITASILGEACEAGQQARREVRGRRAGNPLIMIYGASLSTAFRLFRSVQLPLARARENPGERSWEREKEREVVCNSSCLYLNLTSSFLMLIRQLSLIIIALEMDSRRPDVDSRLEKVTTRQ